MAYPRPVGTGSAREIPMTPGRLLQFGYPALRYPGEPARGRGQKFRLAGLGRIFRRHQRPRVRQQRIQRAPYRPGRVLSGNAKVRRGQRRHLVVHPRDRHQVQILPAGRHLLLAADPALHGAGRGYLQYRQLLGQLHPLRSGLMRNGLDRIGKSRRKSKSCCFWADFPYDCRLPFNFYICLT
jgi:hypothetical protein